MDDTVIHVETYNISNHFKTNLLVKKTTCIVNNTGSVDLTFAGKGWKN